MPLKLPAQIATRAQALRLIPELENLRDHFLQNDVRKQVGETEPDYSALSENLTALFAANQLTAGLETISSLLVDVNHLVRHGLQLRVTLAADPDPSLQARLITWLRDKLDPQLLLQLHVDPSMGGGIILQSTKRRYDFSFRNLLAGGQTSFAEVLRRA